jgi:hypothetical protein
VLYAPGSALSFDPTTGASTSTTFGLSFDDESPDPAVGADGSLYVGYADGIGDTGTKNFVSRVAPGGEVLWTTVDLGTLGPAPDFPGDVFPSTIALGKDDLVVVVVDDYGKKAEVAVVDAFDPATGATRWTTTLDAAPGGGPLVRPDGSIVVLTYRGAEQDLVLLDPATGAATASPIAIDAIVLDALAVTREGAVLVDLNTGAIAALASDGTPLWISADAGNATPTSDGMIFSVGATLMVRDGSTGALRWSLPPPEPGACMDGAVLTSDGGIIALQCDGTLFGASD